MDKLEKSIRHELAYYGPSIRAGHYAATGSTEIAKYGFVKEMRCDVENGIVTGIRLYTVGDAYVPRDYHEQSIDITDPLIDYLRDGDRSWDQLIWGIYRVIEGDK